jgi:nicotinate-nucleotide--dimethylbenzimidazole phosphoribosyltransferase
LSFAIEIPSRENAGVEREVRARWDSLTKPPGSLGRLEPLVIEYALMHGTAAPPLRRKSMVIFCADHGVTAEGVSAWPSDVTRQMVANFISGGAAISVLCRATGIEPLVVDAGVASDPRPGALDRKVARGTANFARGPAMTISQAEQALHAGAGIARNLDADVAGVGEMGIGNTTSASALLCALAGVTPHEAVGRGAGLDNEGVRRKAAVIERALALHAASLGDPVSALAALGGFEIAMMAGFLLGAASRRLPVMVDGFIAGSAALSARAIDQRVSEYLLYSHRSAERAHGLMLDALGAKPLLDLDMRLGEGTGAALGISLLESAVRLYSEMATFAGAGVG